MRSLTWAGVWARRLARHALLDRAPAASLVNVVGTVCGIHAQVMPAAEVSLGIRVDGVTRQHVRAALWEERRLVKTYGIRGTVHLFPADELPLWMAALRPDAAEEAKHLAHLDLTPHQLATLVAALREALDGQCLTLKQLGPEVVRRAGAWAGEKTGSAWNEGWPRWRQVLGAAAVRGVLCFGPNAGAEVTFVRPDQWLGAWHDADPATARAAVLRRYLDAYGPATLRDFAQWFNISVPAAREIARSLGDVLEEVEVEGARGFFLPLGAVEAALPEDGTVRLLPHFDCYVVGCHPRDRLLPAVWRERLPPRTIASQLPTLLVNGTVAGLWERKGTGRRIAVRVESFGPLDAPQRDQLEAEAARVGAVLEAEATLTLGVVEARPHL